MLVTFHGAMGGIVQSQSAPLFGTLLSAKLDGMESWLTLLLKQYSLGFPMYHWMSKVDRMADTAPKTVQFGIPNVPMDVCWQFWTCVIFW